MRRSLGWRITFLSMCVVGLASGTVSAQSQTKTTETRQFEVVSVDGNKVVVKGARGAQEITVPDDFRLTVDGKPVSVRDLKPGMKGTATITTTTTVTPVHVTEVRNAEVMQKAGNSIIVRGPNGIRMFTQADADNRGIKIIKDGKPVDFSEIRQGDRLTATIVTQGAPKVMTQRQVEASLASATPGGAPAARPSPSATSGTGAATPAPAGAPPAPAGAPPAPARKLPKTASPLPAIGLIGAVSLAIGAILTARRRSYR